MLEDVCYRFSLSEADSKKERTYEIPSQWMYVEVLIRQLLRKMAMIMDYGGILPNLAAN